MPDRELVPERLADPHLHVFEPEVARSVAGCHFEDHELGTMTAFNPTVVSLDSTF